MRNEGLHAKFFVRFETLPAGFETVLYLTVVCFGWIMHVAADDGYFTSADARKTRDSAQEFAVTLGRMRPVCRSTKQRKQLSAWIVYLDRPLKAVL